MRKKIAWSSHSCWPVKRPKSSHLLPLPWCTDITGYHTSRKTNYNQWLATDKQEIHYWVRVSQGERKLPETEDTRDNSSCSCTKHYTYCFMHEQSMSISLVFMIKELSCLAPRDICCKQSEFSDYYLVYCLPIILQ